MIRRPPSTTRTTHSFPTRRSSDLLDYHKGIETGQGIITSGAYKGVLANSRMNKASTPFGVLKYLDEEERAKTQERSEEHKSELQSLMRISYAVFCLKKKKQTQQKTKKRYVTSKYNNIKQNN